MASKRSTTVEILTKKIDQEDVLRTLMGHILCWDVIKVVIPHSPEVTTDRRNIVGLRRVCHRTILIKTNALLGKGIEFGLNERMRQEMNR